MKYLAHRSDDGLREQTVLEHLTATAELAGGFAASFGAAEMGSFCGLAHDIGKYSDAFQRRILGAGEKVDHSTAGALEALSAQNIPAAFAIAGHHGGLPDMGNRYASTAQDGTLQGKLKRRVGAENFGLEDYSAYKTELNLPIAAQSDILGKNPESDFFFTRMLYSCLVDADFLDTEHFMSAGGVARDGHTTISTLQQKLSSYTSDFSAAESEINKKRTDILHALIEKSTEDKGLFSLTVPTGGGKTISSMAFALSHAAKHGMDRVIYVIPYTSIIEQTQYVFENILGAENVVAHYSTVSYKVEKDETQTDARMLSTENWDAPIILTTAVQFFESLYGSKSSHCRKLHNIANSVIIFDEAQMLPVPYLRPCISAIAQLAQNYGCTAVLCTATQPASNKLFFELLPEYKIRELCPEPEKMYEFFRRVTYKKVGMLSDEQLAEQLNLNGQVLCIVNSRKQAQTIFDMLNTQGSYYLSTTMCPAHRRSLLVEIRKRLRDKKACRVVSTSLVEAGVDVDFPTVYRAMAGLDSIIQAGGRCNREGKDSPEESIVHIFDTEQKPPSNILQNIAAARSSMGKFEDIASLEAIEDYFEFLFYTLKAKTALDAKNILTDIQSGAMAFESVADRFKIIENSQFNLYIPWQEGEGLTQELLKSGVNRNLLRQLSQYTVGVYPKHFARLIHAGAVQMVSENAAVLLDMQLYSAPTGLSFDVEEGKGIII